MSRSLHSRQRELGLVFIVGIHRHNIYSITFHENMKECELPRIVSAFNRETMQGRALVVARKVRTHPISSVHSADVALPCLRATTRVASALCHPNRTGYLSLPKYGININCTLMRSFEWYESNNSDAS